PLRIPPAWHAAAPRSDRATTGAPSLTYIPSKCILGNHGNRPQGRGRMGVKEGLLALLDDGPRHGYQLKTAFEEVTGGAWPLNVGQVYTTLDRLERDGLVAEVAPAAEGAKKAYALTG